MNGARKAKRPRPFGTWEMRPPEFAIPNAQEEPTAPNAPDDVGSDPKLHIADCRQELGSIILQLIRSMTSPLSTTVAVFQLRQRT